ncbi:MAG TPA: MMPL family transporter, partial [Solirubrobacteraceae bacterium]
MASLLTVFAGRRAKWVIAAVWLLAIAGSFAADLPAKFTDAEKNESTSFLPGDAESTTALTATKRFQNGAEVAPVVIVYRREGGLTAADRRKISTDRTLLNVRRSPSCVEPESRGSSDVKRCLRATAPFSRPVFSRDKTAAIVQAQITGDGEAETILDPVNAVRDRVSDPGGGLETKVTGPAGYAADQIKVFEGINGALLGAGLLLVLILL